MTLSVQVEPHHSTKQLPAPLQAYLEISQQNHAVFMQNRFEFCDWMRQHAYIPVSQLCVDGRLSDFSTNVLGLLPGICHVIRSPGLKRCHFQNASYARRIQRTRKRIESIVIQNAVYNRRPLNFAVAHHSASHNDAHGCMACNNDRELAIHYMRQTAQELRTYFRNGVVIECLLDTDRDSLKVFGPVESLDMADYLDASDDNTALRQELRNRTAHLYQSRRNDIPEWTQFVNEFADLLFADVRYAQSTTNRPFESCTHQEQMIVIGGPLETTNRNAAFLVERGDTLNIIEDLEIAIPTIARNVWQQVLKGASIDTRLPILISLDYDDSQDYHLTSQVALGLIDTLKHKLGDLGSFLADTFVRNREQWWIEAPHDFKTDVIHQNGNIFWIAGAYEQSIRELHLVHHSR